MTPKSAILIVDGYYPEPEFRQQAKAHSWIDICLQQIRRHSQTSNYDIFIYDNALLHSHRQQMRRHGIRHLYPRRLNLFQRLMMVANGVLDYRPKIVPKWIGDSPPIRVLKKYGDLLLWVGLHRGWTKMHQQALDLLVAEVVAIGGYDYLITLDNDLFPIQDGWIEYLIAALEEGTTIAGVWRDEMQDVLIPFVHVSGLCIRLSDLCNLTESGNLSFAKGFAQDVGQNLSLAYYAEKRSLAALTRSNVHNKHSIMGGVYGNLIYHQGAGSRIVKFRTEHNLENNQPVADYLRDCAFRDIDGLVAHLLGTDHQRLPAPFHTIIGPNNYPNERASVIKAGEATDL